MSSQKDDSVLRKAIETSLSVIEIIGKKQSDVEGSVERLFDYLMEVTQVVNDDAIIETIGSIVKILNDYDRGEVDQCSISILLQSIQTSVSEKRIRPSIITILQTFSIIYQSSTLNCIWSYLKDMCHGTYLPSYRVMALQFLIKIFSPSKVVFITGSIVLDPSVGTLRDNSPEVRKGAILGLRTLYNDANHEIDHHNPEDLTGLGFAKINSFETIKQRILDSCTSSALLDPSPAVRKDCVVFLLEILKTEIDDQQKSLKELLLHKLQDKDRSIRCICVRHLLSLEAVDVLEFLRGSSLVEPLLSRGLSSTDCSEKRLSSHLFAFLLDATPDPTSFLVELQVCSKHLFYEEILKNEVRRGAEFIRKRIASQEEEEETK